MRREARRWGAQWSRATARTEPQLAAPASRPHPVQARAPAEGPRQPRCPLQPGSKPVRLHSPLHDEHHGGATRGAAGMRTRPTAGARQALSRHGTRPRFSTTCLSSPGSCVVPCRLQQCLVPRPGPRPLPLCSYPKSHLAACPARYPVADRAGGPVGRHHEAAREKPGRPAVRLHPAATRPGPRWALRPGAGLGGSRKPALAARWPSAAVWAGAWPPPGPSVLRAASVCGGLLR